MGLMIHSISQIPAGSDRSFYLYMLDYGWKDHFTAELHLNFDSMAEVAAQSNSVVIRGTSSHFADEVLSWHHINSEDASELLPALLLTTRTPESFRIPHFALDLPEAARAPSQVDDHLVLIPLRKVCASPADVAPVLKLIFKDISAGKSLTNFAISRELKPKHGSALVASLVLEPNIGGIGVDLKKLYSFLESFRKTK